MTGASGVAGLVLATRNYAPQPAVDPAGSNGLLRLNDWLLQAGTAALVTTGALAVVGAVWWVGSARMREILRLTSPSAEHRGLARYVLPPLLVGTVAMGVSLGHEAGRGARSPVEQLAAQVHADNVLVPYEGMLPFNGGTLPTTVAADAPVSAIPIRLLLGTARNPERSIQPSSASIISLPDTLASALGDTGGGVLTTAQFARIGDVIEVDGTKLTVGGTLDWFPGLDRTAVIVPASIYPALGGETESANVLLLTDDTARDWAAGANIPHAKTVSVQRWLDSYDQFWARSVSPVSMQYLLCLLLVGAVASGFIRSSDLLRRRRQLAVQHILGVPRGTLVLAEYVRAAWETVAACVTGAGAATVLIYLTNSSQYGVSLAVTPSALGAGALLLGAAMAASVTVGALLIYRMDVVDEVR